MQLLLHKKIKVLCLLALLSAVVFLTYHRSSVKDLSSFKDSVNTFFSQEKNLPEIDLDDKTKVEENEDLKLEAKTELEEQINSAEELRKLYLDVNHDGVIKFGSTGNTKNEKSSTANENTDDRSMPLTENEIPNEDSLNKIKAEDFVKGDITFQTFFMQIFELIDKNHLSYPLERRKTLKDGKPYIDNVLFFSQTYDRLSEWDLQQFFDFPSKFLEDLKIKHEHVVNGLPELQPNFYEGNGYVIVGGGKYSWFALLGIETLRKLGSTLPVEVILPNEEDYEFEYCDQILPSLNARCVEMSRVFGKQTLKKFDVSGYQYKAFALLASSFENAFLLDSDSYAVTNPDPVFESKLYQEYKMITWPDFWRRTTSPYFYEIRGTAVGRQPVRHLNDFFVDPKFVQYDKTEDPLFSLTYHDRKGTLPDWTTESGEMLINKKLHFNTLLLALYYNFDGPYGYYPLLSQGGAGEGDKETFVAAANFYKLKYYQVNKMPERAFGWYNEERNYEHSSIVQYSPLVDYDILMKVKSQIENDMQSEGENFEYNYDKYFPENFQPTNSEPMFYHVHDPKMDPFQIVEKKFTLNLDNQKIRNMGEDFPRSGLDLEKFIWGVIDHYVCKEKVEFKCFDGKDWGALCGQFIQEELKFLEESGKRIMDNYDPAKAVDNMRGKEWKD